MEQVMRVKQVQANETRLPEPEAGEAIVVSKYGDGDDRRKAVILHPDDFDLFERYRRIFAAREPYEMRVSDVAVVAHELAERGGDEPDLDLDSLDRALR